MKKFILIIILLSPFLLTYSQSEKGKSIPVTTDSKSGLTLYQQAMKYFDDVNLREAIATFKKALEKDPDFFMANYHMAFYYLLNRSGDDFYKYSDAAIKCKAKLSDAEDLLKEALAKLKDGQSNVVDLGKKLVEMYPNDPNSYSNLVSYQSLAGDSVGMVETLNSAIKAVTNPATFYNQLGYAYLTLNQADKAEEAFNKYIELEPKNPNVYDSKGDYYMYIKKYDKAYESYMIASSLDPAYNHEKAEMAKQLYEQTEGKTLEIRSI